MTDHEQKTKHSSKTGTANRRPKISHRKILESSRGSRLVSDYLDEVLSRKTRLIQLLGRKTSARIITTLLGFELQASYKRIQCPDLVTARYLKIFSELGCRSIHLPYDPTVTARLVPEFENSVDNIDRKVRELFPGEDRLQKYVVQKIYAIVRRQLKFGRS